MLVLTLPLSAHFISLLLASVSSSVKWRCYWNPFQLYNLIIPALQFCYCSVLESCPTLCSPMNCSTPGSSVHHLAEFAQIHVHWIGDAYLTISSSAAPFSFCLVLPSIKDFSSESAVCIRWPKIGVSASASVLPMNIQAWFPFGLTGLISLLSKTLSRVFASTTVWKHQLFSAQSSLWEETLTSVHDYGKTIALTIETFVGKVMPLLFNILSRFVIVFLPRSKNLLISWLQSPSAVILEPKKTKICRSLYFFSFYLISSNGSWWWTGRPGVLLFMGSQRVGHDWETELNWMGPDAVILVFSMLSFKPTFLLSLFTLLRGSLVLLHFLPLEWYHLHIYSENEDHGIRSHHFMGNRWGNSGNSVRLYFYGLQNHCRWWLQPWN